MLFYSQFMYCRKYCMYPCISMRMCTLGQISVLWQNLFRQHVQYCFFLNVVHTPQAGCSPLLIAVFSSRQRVELIALHTVQNLNNELQYRIMRFTLGLDRSWMVMARSSFGMRRVYITISLGRPKVLLKLMGYTSDQS